MFFFVSIYTYILKKKVFEDAINARLVSIDRGLEKGIISHSELGEDKYYNNPNNIYFWSSNRPSTVPDDWQEPRIYQLLTIAASAYIIFDIIYIIMVC
jgi:hypothetical protein